MKNLKTFRAMDVAMVQEHCCICLEKAKKKESIKLLDCGCNAGWFHNSCEIKWVSSFEDLPYLCPTCRRPAPLITNYSFSFYSGNDQRFLWFIATSVAIEFVVCTPYPIAYILPWQSLSIGLLPLIIHTEKTMNFYIYNIIFHHIFNSIFAYIAYYEQESYNDIFQFCVNVGAFQIVILIFISLLTRGAGIDPLTPYAISREIKHRKEIFYTRPSVTKTPANTLKGNKHRLPV
jgi:hypothetical protein